MGARNHRLMWRDEYNCEQADRQLAAYRGRKKTSGELAPLTPDEIDFAPRPEKYEFLNTATGSTFLVDSYSLDAEIQALLMRKVRDARGMVILDNMTFGSYSGTARYQTDYNYDHHFLILGNNGYAYQFRMRLPEKQGQDSPPEEALKILETLQITGK